MHVAAATQGVQLRHQLGSCWQGLWRCCQLSQDRIKRAHRLGMLPRSQQLLCQLQSLLAAGLGSSGAACLCRHRHC